MKRTRFLVTRATTSAVALIGLGLGTGQAGASTPPTDPPPVADESEPTTQPATELVQSWTLTPGGSANGDDAGSRPNLSYQIAAGAVIEDSIIVYNLGNVTMDFRLYATDAYNNDEGEFDLLTGDEVPVDVGSWVTLAQDGIVLEPGKQATIPITITVPVDATPGDHVGAIVASNVAVSDNGDGPVVNVDRRTGTRMYIQVAGELIRELAVTDLQTTYHHALNPLGGSADVSFRVENRGNVRLGGIPSVSISGPFGLGKQTVTLAEMTELLPGEDVIVTATLFDNAPALVIDATQVQIEPVEPTDESGVEPAIGKDRIFAPPISVLMILLAVMLGLLARRAYRRHRAADTVPVEPAVTTPSSSSPSDEPLTDREPQHQ